MLNRIIFIIVLLIHTLIGMNGFCNYDSLLLGGRLNYKDIIIDKKSSQIKVYNAIITKQLFLELQKENAVSDELLDLYFEYIDNMLKEYMISEAFSLLNNLKENYLGSNNHYLWKYWLYMGVAYRYNKDFDQSLTALNNAMSFVKPLSNSIEYDKTLYNIGLAYYLDGKNTEALPFFLKVNSLSQDNYRQFNSRRRIASTYAMKGEFELAINFANGAVQSQVLDSKISSYKEIANIEDVFSYEVYGSALQSRSYVLRQLANSSKDSINYLLYSLRDAKESIIAFERHKRNLIFESDILDFNQRFRYFYYKTIEALSRLHIANDDENLFQEALVYSEMDKVSALLRTVQKVVALNESNIPDSIISKHRSLYQQLSEIEAKRYHENANVRIEDEELLSLNLKLYELVTQIGELEQYLEESYPKYKAEKYKVELPNLDFIYDLSKEKSILEYVVSNEKIYAFLVNDGKIYFHDFYYRKDFIASIERLQEMISRGESIKFSLEEQKEFSDISHQLYLDLIQPFEKHINKKSLLIVPDEQLALIPFEVLLKTKKDSLKSVNYSNLDYLINHFDISYTYSLTLLQKQNVLTKKLRENTLFAIAPGYDMLNEDDSNQYFTFRNTKEKLGALRGAQDEVENVSKRVKGKLLLNNYASEEAFKRHAGEYSVLHLAMHTLVNNENPLYSKLIFTPNADKVEDGMLNTYELSNLHLNADLVVLSACNTGFGKVNKGEGIIGLSRGFFQAGCKSLLATLWAVSDDASANIIEGFYDGLEEEFSKSHSLSQAKRNYLKNTKGMLAHPFFWAGYISIGNDDPIILAKSNKHIKHIGMVGGLLILLISIIIVMYKKKKAGRNPGFQSN